MCVWFVSWRRCEIWTRAVDERCSYLDSIQRNDETQNIAAQTVNTMHAMGYCKLTSTYENCRQQAPGSPQHNLTQWLSHYLISANERSNGRTDNELDEKEEDVDDEEENNSRRAIHGGREKWRGLSRRLLEYMNEQEWPSGVGQEQRSSPKSRAFPPLQNFPRELRSLCRPHLIR